MESFILPIDDCKACALLNLDSQIVFQTSALLLLSEKLNRGVLLLLLAADQEPD